MSYLKRIIWKNTKQVMFKNIPGAPGILAKIL